MLKARYFPYVSFFKARKGGQASWIWSSLLGGRELLREGAHWQVLSGHQTKLWVDKWLPETITGHPSPVDKVRVDKNENVASIIQEDTRNWCLNSIRNLISEEECLAIEATNVRDSKFNDRLIWPMEKKGNYSVKSGYRWIRSKKMRSQVQQLSSSCTTDPLV